MKRHSHESHKGSSLRDTVIYLTARQRARGSLWTFQVQVAIVVETRELNPVSVPV
jgi:hypothetical protein